MKERKETEEMKVEIEMGMETHDTIRMNQEQGNLEEEWEWLRTRMQQERNKQ